MSFNAVVSGSALQPSAAPEIMQPMVQDLNNKTVADVLLAISSNMLTTAWQFEGGWSGWFYAVCKGIVKIIGKFISNSSALNFGSKTKDLEKRLNEYFVSQGCDSNRADEMSKYISNELAC